MSAIPEPTKEQLLSAKPGSIDTEALRFDGPRGDAKLHLCREELEAAILAQPPAPLDRGQVELLVARSEQPPRSTPQSVELSVDGGMPGDKWAQDPRYGREYQLATTQVDIARLIANGQPLPLHGDNLYLNLDLSAANLPIGSILKMGSALLEVTPQAHNGCKKWVQRFGLDIMQMSMEPAFRPLRLRGLYLQVMEAGRVELGDKVLVVSRPQQH